MNPINYLLHKKAKRLEIASSDAYSIFTKTVTTLKSINESIKDEVDSRAQEVLTLQAEMAALATQSASNAKIIDKIG